jgi:hypothetical protein
MVATLERPCADAPVTLSRADGSDAAVRLRLLAYDSCEFESDHRFAVGEMVSLNIYRMGSIRARIASKDGRVFEAEFLNDCPV